MIHLEKRARTIKETPIVKRVIVSLNRLPGVWCGRNNVGKLPDQYGNWVTFGLGVGSPDVVGLVTLGGPRFPIAVPFGVEVKTEARLKKDKDHQLTQEAWRRLARSRGMLCGLVTSDDQAVTLVEGFRVEMTRRLLVLG